MRDSVVGNQGPKRANSVFMRSRRLISDFSDESLAKQVMLDRYSLGTEGDRYHLLGWSSATLGLEC